MTYEQFTEQLQSARHAHDPQCDDSPSDVYAELKAVQDFETRTSKEQKATRGVPAQRS